MIRERTIVMTDIQSSGIQGTEEQSENRFTQAVISLICGIIAMVFFLLFLSSLFIWTGRGMLWLIASDFVALFGFMIGLLAKNSTKGGKMAKAGIMLTAIPLLALIAMPVFSIISLAIAKFF
jgi:hypothetical protein